MSSKGTHICLKVCTSSLGDTRINSVATYCSNVRGIHMIYEVLDLLLSGDQSEEPASSSLAISTSCSFQSTADRAELHIRTDLCSRQKAVEAPRALPLIHGSTSVTL